MPADLTTVFCLNFWSLQRPWSFWYPFPSPDIYHFFVCWLEFCCLIELLGKTTLVLRFPVFFLSCMQLFTHRPLLRLHLQCPCLLSFLSSVCPMWRHRGQHIANSICSPQISATEHHNFELLVGKACLTHRLRTSAQLNVNSLWVLSNYLFGRILLSTSLPQYFFFLFPFSRQGLMCLRITTNLLWIQGCRWTPDLPPWD